MRRRIDMTEVEAATKIRAKYLRALENEEWDLLPGPDVRQDVPAHVRGVPGARPAAARRGVPPALRAAVDAGPDAVRPGQSGQRRRRRRQRRSVGPVPRRARLASSSCSSRSTCSAWSGAIRTDNETPQAQRDAPRRRPTATATPAKKATPKKKKKAAPTRVDAAADRDHARLRRASRTRPARQVINGDYLEPGKSTKTFRSQRFRVNLGNGDVRMRVGGKQLSPRPTSGSRSATRCGRARSPRGSREAARIKLCAT